MLNEQIQYLGHNSACHPEVLVTQKRLSPCVAFFCRAELWERCGEEPRKMRGGPWKSGPLRPLQRSFAFGALAPVPRRETPKRILFNVRHRRATPPLWPAPHRSHHVGIRIPRRRGLPTEQPLQKIKNDAKPRPPFPSITHNHSPSLRFSFVYLCLLRGSSFCFSIQTANPQTPSDQTAANLQPFLPRRRTAPATQVLGRLPPPLPPWRCHRVW